MAVEFFPKAAVLSKVSVQGVVELSGHFATLCQAVDFYEVFFFSLSIFKKEKKIILYL